MAPKMIKEIILVNPRGFCAGVARAVKILSLAAQKSREPVYMRHEIVHNRRVVQDFVKKGIKFVENISDIPRGATVVFSAHGSSPQLYEQAQKRHLTVIDATCPLVTKVHLEAKRFVDQGYFVIYLGHKNHPEPEGVLGEIAKDRYVFIDSLEQAKKLRLAKNETKLVILTQTTLSFDDTKDIISLLRRRYPQIGMPPTYDICYATQNRQNAVKALVKHVDTVLVVGSKTSSNSNRLVDVAKNLSRRAYLLDRVADIKDEWLTRCQKLGITAGASAPEELIAEIVDHIRNQYGGEVKELEVLKEQVEFPNLPKELGQL